MAIWGGVGTAAGMALGMKKALEERRRSHPGATLVFLCHSMGSLVVQHATDVVGLGSDTRRVITLGTPFRGTAKALGVLAGSWPSAAPFQCLRHQLSELAGTFPSVYELLPRYRAIVEGSTVRPIELGDLGLSGKDELFERSTAFHASLEVPGPRPYRRTVVVGSSQRTWQYAQVANGVVELLHACDGAADERGDGTVPRQSVPPPEWPDDGDAFPLPQAHLGPPYAPSTFRVVRNALTATPRDQQDMAERAQLALDVPDLVLAGTPASMLCEVVAGDPGVPLVVTVQQADSERAARATRPQMRDGRMTALFHDLPPGDYLVSLGPAGPISGVAPVHDAFTVVEPAVEAAAR